MRASTNSRLRFLVPVLLLVTGAPAGAQSDDFRIPGTNPPATVQERIAATDIRVQYHRPRARGREIFGALVPWDRVWRTGADNATRISFSRDVELNGVPVQAGDYELFSIPGRAEWTLIIHADQSQWGSYSYDPANDVARIPVVPEEGPHVESFTIAVEDIAKDRGTLVVAWDRVRVPVEVTVDVAALVPEVEAALTLAQRPPYFFAAMFYWENGLDIDRAAELIALALEQSPGHIGILHRQALILADAGDVEGAIAAARRSMEGAESATPELRDEYLRLNRALIERLGG